MHFWGTSRPKYGVLWNSRFWNSRISISPKIRELQGLPVNSSKPENASPHTNLYVTRYVHKYTTYKITKSSLKLNFTWVIGPAELAGKVSVWNQPLCIWEIYHTITSAAHTNILEFPTALRATLAYIIPSLRLTFSDETFMLEYYSKLFSFWNPAEIWNF